MELCDLTPVNPSDPTSVIHYEKKQPKTRKKHSTRRNSLLFLRGNVMDGNAGEQKGKEGTMWQQKPGQKPHGHTTKTAMIVVTIIVVTIPINNLSISFSSIHSLIQSNPSQSMVLVNL